MDLLRVKILRDNISIFTALIFEKVIYKGYIQSWDRKAVSSNITAHMQVVKLKLVNFSNKNNNKYFTSSQVSLKFALPSTP